MDYRDRHVVITGGTGALGTAVVSALLALGAICHVPYTDERKAQRFPQRGNQRVVLIADCKRVVQLEFFLGSKRYRRISLAKIDLLIKVLMQFRRALAKEIRLIEGGKRIPATKSTKGTKK